MENRGLLTKGDRKAFTGEREVDDSRLVDIRHNIRKRMDRVERDLAILRDAGEDELIEDFYERFSREARLERRIEQLEEQVRDE